MEAGNEDEKRFVLPAPYFPRIYAGVAAAAYFIVISLVFRLWVNHFYCGNDSGPLMISEYFGVSEPSLRAGARPTFGKESLGWDGQFYYTQSNNPFLQDCDHNSRFFDTISYRYQRNGLPLTAWSVSRLLGQAVTYPIIYFATSFAIVSIGFGCFVAILREQKRPIWWALIWGCFGGVLHPLLHGLPDPASDAVFLLVILCVAKKQLMLYALLSSYLCLCRESYAAPAFVIWVITLFRSTWWNSKLPYSAVVVMTAMPGACVLAWSCYVAIMTETGFLSGARSVPWGGLVDLPFFAYLRCLGIQISSSEINRDFFFSTSCLAILVIVLFRLIGHAKQQPLLWALVVHVLIMTMTGKIIWETPMGYFKNASSVLLIAILLQANQLKRSTSIAIGICLFCSLIYVLRSDFLILEISPPREVSQNQSESHSPSDVAMTLAN